MNVTVRKEDYPPEYVDVPMDEDWGALLTIADREEPDSAELEELVGKNILVKVFGWATSGFGSFRECYIQIIKDSGNQFTVKVVPRYFVNRSKYEMEDWLNRIDTIRVRKSNIRPIRTRSGDLITEEF